ncbi:MAG: alpha-amylase/4-alpha-glucanotransferase domain-containing protein [Pseudomonadota bacterium]
MGKVYLLFAIHSHQPVGNFEHVFAKAVRDSYGPFIELLEDHPRVRLSMHYSGPLLEWIEAHHPVIIERLQRLVRRNQVEILGGGFYEPLLPSLPQRDVMGQLQAMNDYCQSRFQRRPQGFWLTERVWDPAIPARIDGSGLKFTIVDDNHLLYAGLTENDLRGYYVTEREGKMLAVFPTHKRLRYLIPFRPVAETMDFLHEKAASADGVALTYGDDGEKFGVWPGTHKWVFEEKWLIRFMEAVEAADWLDMMPLGEYLERFPPTGRVYMPTASYQEMTEWALPVEAQLRYEDVVAEIERLGKLEEWRPFIRAGIWDNFLVKYSEANLMHKRMLWVSSRVQDSGPEARRELYRGQCNCSYWHGLFGGLYLKHLRQAIFHHLIAAERMAEAGRPSGWIELERCDYDRDGADELVVANSELFASISPHAGGSLLELDYKPSAVNLTDTLTRRREAYHRGLREASQSQEATSEGRPLSIHERTAAKEKGLERLLVYDKYDRRSFLDHIVAEDSTAGCTLETVCNCGLMEEGSFVSAPYRLLGHELGDREAVIRLERCGSLHRGGKCHLLRLTKTYRFSQEADFVVDYELTNHGEELSAPLPYRFGVELNLSPVGESDPAVYYLLNGARHAAGECLEAGPVGSLGLVDERLDYQIQLNAEPAAHQLSVWPLETVSQSDEGFERNRQGTVVLLSWKAGLENPLRFRIRVKASSAR